MSQEVKAIRQWNLVSLQNIARKIFIFKNHVGNDVGRLVLDLFLFFEKALHKVKISGQRLSFIIFW